MLTSPFHSIPTSCQSQPPQTHARTDTCRARPRPSQCSFHAVCSDPSSVNLEQRLTMLSGRSSYPFSKLQQQHGRTQDAIYRQTKLAISMISFLSRLSWKVSSTWQAGSFQNNASRSGSTLGGTPVRSWGGWQRERVKDGIKYSGGLV